MKIAESIETLKDVVKEWRMQGLSIGFVPTMGNLHAGHISLVNEAKSQCDKVVVSVYVNPLQFNESSDFESYPVTLQEDQSKLRDVQTDLLFLPSSEVMYPEGEASVSKVSVPDIGDMLEGECRPGHFDGVATVVNKLFNMVQPDTSFFGFKDYQQLLLVQKMVRDLNMPVDIRSVKTQREASGLAMSSRNSRLSATQREQAPELYKTLQWCLQCLSDNTIEVHELEQKATKRLVAAGFEPEYVSLRSANNLQPLTHFESGSVILAAARLGDVRLIDNILCP